MTGYRHDATTIDIVAQGLGRQGYVSVPAAHFSSQLPEADLEAFCALWESLPPDRELPDAGRYRLRRYGRVRAEHGSDGTLFTTPLPHAGFRQAAEHIPLYQGRERTFAAIPEPVLLHPTLHTIVAFDLAVISRLVRGVGSWLVGLHMIRIVAERGLRGQPTPEGRHRDGHRYVGMHLMRRIDCRGGESLIYLPGEPEPALALTLLEPLDSLLVDDSACEHEVTPVEADNRRAVRDVLLVDLNAASGSI